MIVRTRQSNAQNAADAWRNQYCANGKWEHVRSGSAEYIYKQLLALDKPTPEAVEVIIGNTSWTDLVCSACQTKVNRVAVFTAFDETLLLCVDCLHSAIAALRAHGVE